MLEGPFITILTVNFNTADFVINILECLPKITKNAYKVIIADNNSEIKEYKKLESFCKNKQNVELYRKEGFSLKGSIAHGTALNELVEKVDTPYFSILDSDATWLKKDWDETLIKNFTDEIKVIGTQAPVGSPKHQDFPLMFCILFETEVFKSLKIDFRPQDLDQHQDTGWELREKYLAAGYKGKIIEMKNTRTYQEGPFKDLVGVAEYYYNNDYTDIYASHFGRGATLGKNKFFNKKSSLFKRFFYYIPFLGNYLLTLKGKKEKQAWIDTCHNTVN